MLCMEEAQDQSPVSHDPPGTEPGVSLVSLVIPLFIDLSERVPVTSTFVPVAC